MRNLRLQDMVFKRVYPKKSGKDRDNNKSAGLQLGFILAPFAIACLTLYFLLSWIRINAQTKPIESKQWGTFQFMLKDINLTQQLELYKQMEENDLEQSNMAKILYFLMLTDGEEWKALRLLQRIQAPNNFYMFHLDSKMNSSDRKKFVDSLTAMNETTKNIYILQSYQATYKGITLVDQELTAMATSISLNMDWTHYINLSPSAYPLISQYEISKLLGQAPPQLSFLELLVADCQTILDRFTHIYYDLGLWGYSSRGAIESKQRVPVPKGIKLFKAFQWKVLSRELGEYFVISSDGWARRLFAYFVTTLIPDEHYFSTAACNSPAVNETIRRAKLHYMNWEDIDWSKRAGKIGPNTITLELLEKALNLGAFFARKFDDDYAGAQSIQLVDQLLDEGQTVINGNVYTREMQYNSSYVNLFQNSINGQQCWELLEEEQDQLCVSKRLHIGS